MHQGTAAVGEINAVTITRDMLRLYGQHAYTVIGTSALIQGVALVASFLAFNTLGLAGLLVWVVTLVVAYQLSMGVFTKLLLHLRHGHDVPSPGYLIKETAPHLGPLIWLGILVGVGTFVGFLFLVVPGIYLALRWGVAPPALVARKTSAVESMRISGEVTVGHKGTVFVLAAIAYFFSNGLPQLLQTTNPTMAMENVFIVQAVVATFATPIVALATAELFLRLARVPDRIVPGVPLGGPAPAPAGPFVPTAAVPAQQVPSPYAPQPAPAAGFAPVHAAAPPHHIPGGFAPVQAHAVPAPAAAGPFVQQTGPQHYAPPAAPQHYAPPAPPAAPQHYAPPAPPAAPQHYAPPAPPAAPQHHAPPAPPAAPQAYVPPMPGAAPVQRQGPSVAPPGLG